MSVPKKKNEEKLYVAPFHPKRRLARARKFASPVNWHLRRDFLKSLKRNNGNVSKACASIKVARRTVEKYIADKKDPDFNEKVAEILAAMNDNVEETLFVLASTESPSTHADRKLWLQEKKGYQEKKTVTHTHKFEMSDEDVIRMIETAEDLGVVDAEFREVEIAKLKEKPKAELGTGA